MQALYDFLSFKSFISLEVLIGIYYLGALGVPLAAWSLSRRVGLKASARPKGKYATYALLLFIVLFGMMEIFWRVMFEFMVGYFQMRDALVL